MKLSKEELEKIIKTIDNEKKDEFLLDTIIYDDNLYDTFRRYFINYFPLLTYHDYIKKIYDAISNCEDRKGYIDYANTWKYTRAMYEYTNEAKIFVENNNYDTAFDIVEIILNSIPDVSIDDSNGSTGEVAYDCIKIIKDILEKSFENNKNNINKRILNFIIEEVKSKSLANYGIETYELFDFYVDNKL